MQAPPLATFDHVQLDRVTGGWDWTRTQAAAQGGAAAGTLGGAMVGMSFGPLDPLTVTGGALVGFGVGAALGAGADAVSQVVERWRGKPSGLASQCGPPT